MTHAQGKHRAQGPLVVLKLLRTFLRPYYKQLIWVVALLSIDGAGSLFLPSLNADLINNGIVKGDLGYIWRTGVVMLGIALGAGVISLGTVYWVSRVAIGFGADMRAAVYQRVQSFSAFEMNRFGISSLITRNINDCGQVQVFLEMVLNMLVFSSILCVGGVIMAIREGTQLSLLLVVAVPVMAVVIGVTLVTVLPLFRILQTKVDRINQVLREQITGVRVIRAFGRTRSERDRFAHANADITGISLRTNRIFIAISPLMMVILTLSCVGVIWFGGRLVREGSLPIGNLIAFLTYILQILVAVLIGLVVVLRAPRAVASAERIEQVFSVVPAITAPARPVTPVSLTGAVEFRDVSFGYAGSERPVLRDLTFTLEPGRSSAIIGGTGSGKSTLLNLIPRLLDVTSGSVLVHGTDVREQSAEQLWSTIGLVPQELFLFRGTVASNLRFGMPDATDEQLWRALSVAQALDFVASMPGQLDAPIDQGGTNISTGQRQRLSIARALVRPSQLYLFDDCFSALDAATDARLRAALRAETRNAAVVMVTQRISTVMHADQIVVLDAGRVAGIGNHRQLLIGCAPYQEIAASQLSDGAAA